MFPLTPGICLDQAVFIASDHLIESQDLVLFKVPRNMRSRAWCFLMISVV